MSHRQNIPGTSPYESVIGFSRAVRIGNHVHVSGTGPVGADSGDVSEQAEDGGTCALRVGSAAEQTGGDALQEASGSHTAQAIEDEGVRDIESAGDEARQSDSFEELRTAISGWHR